MVSRKLLGVAMSFVQRDWAWKKVSCAKDFSWKIHSVLCDYRCSDMVSCRAPLGRDITHHKIGARVRRTCTKAVMAFESARLELSVSNTVHRGSNSIYTGHRNAFFQIKRNQYSSLWVFLQTSNFICLFPQFYLLSLALYLAFYCQEFDSQGALFCEGYQRWIAFASHRYKKGLQAKQPWQETFYSPQ